MKYISIVLFATAVLLSNCAGINIKGTNYYIDSLTYSSYRWTG